MVGGRARNITRVFWIIHWCSNHWTILTLTRWCILQAALFLCDRWFDVTGLCSEWLTFIFHWVLGFCSVATGTNGPGLLQYSQQWTQSSVSEYCNLFSFMFCLKWKEEFATKAHSSHYVYGCHLRSMAVTWNDSTDSHHPARVKFWEAKHECPDLLEWIILSLFGSYAWTIRIELQRPRRPVSEEMEMEVGNFLTGEWNLCWRARKVEQIIWQEVTRQYMAHYGLLKM